MYGLLIKISRESSVALLIEAGAKTVLKVAGDSVVSSSPSVAFQSSEVVISLMFLAGYEVNL